MWRLLDPNAKTFLFGDSSGALLCDVMGVCLFIRNSVLFLGGGNFRI